MHASSVAPGGTSPTNAKHDQIERLQHLPSPTSSNQGTLRTTHSAHLQRNLESHTPLYNLTPPLTDHHTHHSSQHNVTPHHFLRSPTMLTQTSTETTLTPPIYYPPQPTISHSPHPPHPQPLLPPPPPHPPASIPPPPLTTGTGTVPNRDAHTDITPTAHPSLFDVLTSCLTTTTQAGAYLAHTSVRPATGNDPRPKASPHVP